MDELRKEAEDQLNRAKSAMTSEKKKEISAVKEITEKSRDREMEELQKKHEEEIEDLQKNHRDIIEKMKIETQEVQLISEDQIKIQLQVSFRVSNQLFCEFSKLFILNFFFFQFSKFSEKQFLVMNNSNQFSFLEMMMNVLLKNLKLFDV